MRSSLLICALLPIWSYAQQPLPRPKLVVKQGRVATPAWVTTSWNVKSDAPFAAIDQRLRLKRREGATQDEWREALLRAYQSWRTEPANAERLFEVSLTFAYMKADAPTVLRSKEAQVIWEDVYFGWFALVKAPPSRLLVREGYRALAGRSMGVWWGDLARVLLKADPLDHVVIYSAISELLEERRLVDSVRMRPVRHPDKAEPFEKYLFEVLSSLRKSKKWIPWGDLLVSDVWYARYCRTGLRTDLQKSIALFDLGAKVAPADRYPPTELAETRKMRVQLLRFAQE